MNRPKKSDYPVIYYDDGLKQAKNPRELPVWIDEWASAKEFLERSYIYRQVCKERIKYKKYTQVIKDIIYSKEGCDTKVERIKKTLVALSLK